MSDDAAKELIARAVKLREEGRIEEAVLAARRATTLDDEDPNAWWQLALASEAKGDAILALPALRRVVDLAPNFAYGWHKLGLSLQRAQQGDDAIDAFEHALEADEDHIPSMRRLVALLHGRTDAESRRRRLALLEALAEKDTLESDEHFTLGYLLVDAGRHAEGAHAYEGYTQAYGGQTSFFNLALCYRQLKRELDALDALSMALSNGYDLAKVEPTLKSLQQLLRPLRNEVLATPLAKLNENDWYRYYVNPFSLLNVDPTDVADNPKELQKARKALLREIELEDGRLEWLPGLIIDKSAAISVIDELDKPEAWGAHEIVFSNPKLNEFLMYGSLEHFLISADGTGGTTMPHLQDVDHLAVIGPRFAAQFDMVLSNAAENKNLKVVQCLLAGRLWVLPGHRDACFASTRRLLDRLSEPLERLQNAARVRKISPAEVQAMASNGGLRELLALMPADLHEAHSKFVEAIRSLVITYIGQEKDPEKAKNMLAIASASAAKSHALQRQFETEMETLTELIAEQKASEAHLTLGSSELKITRAGVSYGHRSLAPVDIVGIRWGLVQTSRQPATVRHTIAFQARRGTDIEVTWTTSTNLVQQKELWKGLVDAAFAYIVDTVYEEFEKALNRGEVLRVGTVPIRSSGVVLPAKGWLWTNEEHVPWSRLSAELENGEVVLRDKANPKATASIPLESTYNAILLHMMVKTKEHNK